MQVIFLDIPKDLCDLAGREGKWRIMHNKGETRG